MHGVVRGNHVRLNKNETHWRCLSHLSRNIDESKSDAAVG